MGRKTKWPVWDKNNHPELLPKDYDDSLDDESLCAHCGATVNNDGISVDDQCCFYCKAD